MTRLVVLTLALALSGCPSSHSGKTDAPDASPSPSVQVATPPPTPPTPPPATPQETGVGPALPPYPHPDDGRSGTHLLPTSTIQVGQVPLKVWVADREPQRRLGLMHVTSMPEDRGMLFVYPSAGYRSFWMKNTKIPLSLAYIGADGRIAQILDMQPMTTHSHPSKATIRLVLEVNQGWFQRHGIEVGTPIPGIAELPGYP